MKLRFNVDQAQSFRLGINAETSIVDLEVDPAQLEQADRDLIARHMRKGIEVHGINSHDNWTGIIETDAPTVEALLTVLKAEQADNAKEVAKRAAKLEQEQAERQIDIEACREGFLARQVKVVKKQSYYRDRYVSYECLEPAFDTYRRGDVPGCSDWIKELETQCAEKRDEAVEAYKKELEAEELKKEAKNLERARFVGMEDEWAKGYITEEGLITAVDDKIRAKYGVLYDEPQSSCRGKFDLTLAEITKANVFRAKLPEGATVVVTGNRKQEPGMIDPTRIVMYATWQEEGSMVPATEVLRDNTDDDDEEDDDN